MREWSAWLPGGMLTLGCIFTLAVDRQHPSPLALPLDSIPTTMAGRPGSPGTARARCGGCRRTKAAGVSSYLFRWYAGDEAPFDIYVGYYEEQTQGRTIHSPKNCLPGSGWEALKQSVEQDTDAGTR